MTTVTGLPTDEEVLDRARRHLSEARDWLASDTSTVISGRRSRTTASLIDLALRRIGEAKAAIDAAKSGR